MYAGNCVFQGEADEYGAQLPPGHVPSPYAPPCVPYRSVSIGESVTSNVVSAIVSICHVSSDRYEWRRSTRHSAFPPVDGRVDRNNRLSPGRALMRSVDSTMTPACQPRSLAAMVRTSARTVPRTSGMQWNEKRHVWMSWNGRIWTDISATLPHDPSQANPSPWIVVLDDGGGSRLYAFSYYWPNGFPVAWTYVFADGYAPWGEMGAGESVAMLSRGTDLLIELREFASMIAIGAGPQRSAFLSSFFTLVGCHGAHVTAGLMWIGTMMAQIWAKGFREDIVRRLLCLSIFWHALDIIWVAIFTIVYLIGTLP